VDRVLLGRPLKKIPGKYPVIVGVFPANISENGAIKSLEKTQKSAKRPY
jgi:hypothetical protein